jgi:hypothetical protein
MERIEHIDSKEVKGQKTITIHLKGGNEPRLMLSPQVRLIIHFVLLLFLMCACIFIYLHVSVLLCFRTVFRMDIFVLMFNGRIFLNLP